MQDYWWWWGLAVLFGVLEIVTGTFYLLVLATGLVAGGLVAFGGGAFVYQLLATSVFSIVGFLLLRRLMPQKPREHASSNRDLLLDIGERVRIEKWHSERRTQVVYRGAAWTVELSADEAQAPDPGDYVIRRIEGNRLIVARQA